jgi:hypothetical protein
MSDGHAKSKNKHSAAETKHATSEAKHPKDWHRGWILQSGIALALVVTISICVWLWHVEWLRPWLASFGAALVVALGPIPGLLRPEVRSKWLALVGVAVLIGIGTWYATKYEENERDDARHDALFSESLLKKVPSGAQDELCKDEAKPLQQLVLHRNYQEAVRRTTILRDLSPANGHALAFAGYGYEGLKDYGEMLTAFRRYLYYADKNKSEAFSGDAEFCYERVSGYCAERTAWIENLLAKYYFERAQREQGSQKTASLQQAITEVDYMLKARNIGFDSDSTALDTVDLLNETADQLRNLGQTPDKPLALAAQVADERRKAARPVPQTSNSAH